MDYIDLHTHSTCSDGSLSPARLIKEAKNCGLRAIALTDHDTMAGTDEALAAGQELHIEVMPGVEISANYGPDPVHIIGYGMDQHNPELLALLGELQKARIIRNDKILKNLASLGKPIDKNELEESSHGLIGRPHIARLMVKHRMVGSIDDAFKRYLKRGAKAFIAAKRFPAADSIRTISQAGGVAVLAHPTTIARDPATIENIVKDLASDGLSGIEAIYPGHSSNTCKLLIETAEKYDLIYTGGSDFHGSVKAINLGGAPVMPPVPYKLFENLQERLIHNRQRVSSPPERISS